MARWLAQAARARGVCVGRSVVSAAMEAEVEGLDGGEVAVVGS